MPGLNTPELKPFKDYYTRPVIYYSGNYSLQIVDDPEAKTGLLSEEQSDGNINAPGGSETVSSDKEDQSRSNDSMNAGFQLSIDPMDWLESFQAFSHEQW